MVSKLLRQSRNVMALPDAAPSPVELFTEFAPADGQGQGLTCVAYALEPSSTRHHRPTPGATELLPPGRRQKTAGPRLVARSQVSVRRETKEERKVVLCLRQPVNLRQDDPID
jgi:hypothetical protein